MSAFTKATKRKAKGRIALDGPSGSGKTYTALAVATFMAGEGGRIALIDSERGSASKYADRFDFDVLELTAPFHPDKYVSGLKDAAEAGYDVVIVDSLTHAWAGPGGILELVDVVKKKFSGNSFAAWSELTPLWNRLIDTMLDSPAHVIATMRSKAKYVETPKASGTGKTYERAGTEPVARDGVEYEFDIVGDLDNENTLTVAKTRCPELASFYRKPGREFAETIMAWLGEGAPAKWEERWSELLRDLPADEVKALLRNKRSGEEIDPKILDREDVWAKARKVVDEAVASKSAPAESDNGSDPLDGNTSEQAEAALPGDGEQTTIDEERPIGAPAYGREPS